MNKSKKILIAILGGMDVFLTVATPILLVLVWLSIFGIKNHWSTYVFLLIGICSSLFRAIKIGWITK